MKYIYELKNIPSDKTELIGGKAKSLAVMLSSLKINIPEGYVITSEACRAGALIDEAAAELDALIPRLKSDCTYAVRSSALNEDAD